MLKSKQIRSAISNPGNVIGKYKLQGNTVYVEGVKMCRIFKSFATFNFSITNPTVINDLRCFMEGVDIPVYPIPEPLFTYETEEVLANDEIAGRGWTSFVSSLEVQALSDKNKLPLLESIVTGYFNLYGGQGISAPTESQKYFRTLDLVGIAKKTLENRQARHEVNFKEYLDKWKKNSGQPVLKNRTGKEYIRLNETTRNFETTLGVIITPGDMLKGMEHYTSGSKEFNIKAHMNAKDEDNKDTFVEFDLPVIVQESGDVVINCVTIAKEEFMSAVKMLT